MYGTQLHKVLQVKSSYREWIKRRFNDIDAIENEDFESVEISTVVKGTPKKDHIIKLDTAKEMAMPGCDEKGKNGMCILLFATMPHIIVKEGICLWTVLSAGLEERNY